MPANPQPPRFSDVNRQLLTFVKTLRARFFVVAGAFSLRKTNRQLTLPQRSAPSGNPDHIQYRQTIRAVFP